MEKIMDSQKTKISKERSSQMQEYNKENRDKLTLSFPKGKKEEYREYAKHKGMSLSALIVSLIETDMQKNCWK